MDCPACKHGYPALECAPPSLCPKHLQEHRDDAEAETQRQGPDQRWIPDLTPDRAMYAERVQWCDSLMGN